MCVCMGEGWGRGAKVLFQAFKLLELFQKVDVQVVSSLYVSSLVPDRPLKSGRSGVFGDVRYIVIRWNVAAIQSSWQT